LTVELLEDRRVFSLTGPVPSLPGLLSHPVSLPALSSLTPAAVVPVETTAAPVSNVLTETAAPAQSLLGSLPLVSLDTDLRLDTGAGGLRVELAIVTPVIDLVVVSDLGVNLPVPVGTDLSLNTSLGNDNGLAALGLGVGIQTPTSLPGLNLPLGVNTDLALDTSVGGNKGLIALGTTDGADVKVDLGPETGLPPIDLGTGMHVGVGGNGGALPIDATVGTTTTITLGGTDSTPPVNVGTGTGITVTVGGDQGTLPVDVTVTSGTTVTAGGTSTIPPVGGTGVATHGGGVPGDLGTSAAINVVPTNSGVVTNSPTGVSEVILHAVSMDLGTSSPVLPTVPATSGSSVDRFFQQLTLDGGNAGAVPSAAADALAFEPLALATPTGGGGAQEEDLESLELQGADLSGLLVDLSALPAEAVQGFKAVGDQLSALLAGTGTAPWLLALLAVAATACEIARRQARHARPRLSLAEAAALTGFPLLGNLWPLE